MEETPLKIEENNEENALPKPVLRVITGGKGTGGGGPIINNWLQTLPPLTRFIAKTRGAGVPLATDYEVILQGRKVTRLLITYEDTEEDDPKRLYHWVDTLQFSKQMELLEIL